MNFEKIPNCCLLLCVTAFMAGVIVSFIPYEANANKFNEVIITAGTTLVAAFLGAFMAFKYQLVIQKKAREDKDFVNGNLALTRLLIMRNKLQKFKMDFVSPHMGNEKLWFVMIPPVPEGEHDNISVNTGVLTFLYNTEDLGLVGDIDICWIHYESTISSIRLRSSFYHDVVMPILQQDIKFNLIFLNNDIVLLNNIVGSIHCQNLETYTKAMIAKIDHTIGLLDRTKTRLEKQMEIRFPSRTIATESNMVPLAVSQESQEC